MMVTTIERTIADLARTEPELGDVADALAGAYLRGAVDLETLAPMLDAAARRHGASNGSELLERMLELRGLDATSALAELARLPYLSRLLGAAWAPIIQSALQEAVSDAIPSDLGRYNDMARLARQATAGLPSALVSEATQDE